MLRPPSISSSLFSSSSSLISPRLPSSSHLLIQRRLASYPLRPQSQSLLTRTRLNRLYNTGATSAYPPPPPRRSRLLRFAGFTTIAVVSFLAGAYYHLSTNFTKIMTANILTDEETLTAYTPEDAKAEEVDAYLRSHPEAERLRANPDFREARPHLKIPIEMRSRSLTAGTLAGANKIVVPPLTFSERGGKSFVSLMYLGSDICGHPGIIHGGLLATLLDEGLARCCFPALPNKIGVTANLNIDYRAPAMANSYVALRAETIKVEGRKAWVEGRIETLPAAGEQPVVLVEAKALFIEPKQAASLASVARKYTE